MRSFNQRGQETSENIMKNRLALSKFRSYYLTCGKEMGMIVIAEELI